MAGRGNVAGDIGVDDGGIEKLLVWLVFAMFLLLLSTGLQTFRHCKDLALMLVMKLQVMTILLNMVVVISILAESFFNMEELLALFIIIIIIIIIII